MQPVPDFSSPLFRTALLAAERGGSELVKRSRKSVSVQSKGIANFVSEADLAAESAVIQTIREHYPDHAILSEESHQSLVGQAEHLWIIDPLDGTNNFLHGIPHFAVSIAYYHCNEPTLGIIYNPIYDEIYSAVRGQGAWLGTERQTVSNEKRLSEVVVAFGFYYDRDRMMQATLNTLADFFKSNIHGVRRFGAAALDLCHVGCGQYGLFFEYRLSPWDYAAGQLFLQEAGGRCTNCDGAPLPISQGSSICASNGHVHDEALAVIAPHWRSLHRES
jgi:myo-inositol-1(or 4)-monophosphatase